MPPQERVQAAVLTRGVTGPRGAGHAGRPLQGRGLRVVDASAQPGLRAARGRTHARHKAVAISGRWGPGPGIRRPNPGSVSLEHHHPPPGPAPAPPPNPALNPRQQWAGRDAGPPGSLLASILGPPLTPAPYPRLLQLLQTKPFLTTCVEASVLVGFSIRNLSDM